MKTYVGDSLDVVLDVMRRYGKFLNQEERDAVEVLMALKQCDISMDRSQTLIDQFKAVPSGGRRQT